MCELFVKVAWLWNEHLPLYKKSIMVQQGPTLIFLVCLLHHRDLPFFPVCVYCITGTSPHFPCVSTASLGPTLLSLVCLLHHRDLPSFPLCVYCIQGWEFAHLLIAHLLIRSFCSNQMSNCERFAQIAQDK